MKAFDKFWTVQMHEQGEEWADLKPRLEKDVAIADAEWFVGEGHEREDRSEHGTSIFTSKDGKRIAAVVEQELE